MLYSNLLTCIGNTPLVQLKLDDQAKGRVFAKLELMNPYGMKDRVAQRIIMEAKKEGILKERMPIIESSSGTMALGVAMIGTYLGHEVHIITDPRIDPITDRKLKALGCTMHVVSKMTSQGWQSARLERLHELKRQLGEAFWPQQYENPNNPLAYCTLAEELTEALDNIDILVGAVGSGGSLCGTARSLLEKYPALQVVAVDCVGSVIFGQPDNPNRLQGGLGNSLVAKNVDYKLIHQIHWLNDQESFSATIELAHHEKIFAGNSSGSVYAVSRWLSRNVSSDTNIVAIFPDRGDRYFSTIYDGEYWDSKGLKRVSLTVPEEVQLNSVVQGWSYSYLKGDGLFGKEANYIY